MSWRARISLIALKDFPRYCAVRYCKVLLGELSPCCHSKSAALVAIITRKDAAVRVIGFRYWSHG